MPIMTLQKTMTPTSDRPVDDAVNDCARVAARMIISSIPYMRFRPIQSAIYPNTNCPITVPTEVATLMAVSPLVGITPLEVCQYTRPSIAVVRLIAKIWKHPSQPVFPGSGWRHHTYIIRIGEEACTGHDHSTNMVPSER